MLRDSEYTNPVPLHFLTEPVVSSQWPAPMTSFVPDHLPTILPVTMTHIVFWGITLVLGIESVTAKGSCMLPRAWLMRAEAKDIQEGRTFPLFIMAEMKWRHWALWLMVFHHLQNPHFIWTLVWVVSITLPSHAPSNIPEKTIEDDPGVWENCQLHKGPRWSS